MCSIYPFLTHRHFNFPSISFFVYLECKRAQIVVFGVKCWSNNWHLIAIELFAHQNRLEHMQSEYLMWKCIRRYVLSLILNRLGSFILQMHTLCFMSCAYACMRVYVCVCVFIVTSLFSDLLCASFCFGFCLIAKSRKYILSFGSSNFNNVFNWFAFSIHKLNVRYDGIFVVHMNTQKRVFGHLMFTKFFFC